MHLNQRSFEPRQILALARAQRDPVLRRQILDGLEATAGQDQLDVRQAVEALGGRLVKSFWTSNSCLVEIPAARSADLTRNTRVRRIWPNEARGPATVSPEPLGPVPIKESGDDKNHNFTAAWARASHNGLLTTRKGGGVVVGFFDTGLDLDDGSGSPHSCYRDAAGTGTRLLGSTLVPGNPFSVLCGTNPVTMQPIDCNSTGVHPYNGSTTHFDARHGTGMSSIAVGRGVRVPVYPSGSTYVDGHAPDAWVAGWSISRGTPQWNNCSLGTIRWTTDAATYLSAIQMLVLWYYESGFHVDVLNISFDGWPDPDHPVELALDQLANDENILIVVSAGNDGDSSALSHGFYNGLSVGATKKIMQAPPAPNQLLRDVARYSARGPLQGNLNRFYPDLVAVGGDDHVSSGQLAPTQHLVNLARVDDFGSPNWNYATMGTSLAAPQVSGAAALYLARRAAVAPAIPAATALEAKAAILACLSDPSPTAAAQWGQGYLNTDTYHNRNGYGRGFLRDDYLVDFAERFGNAAIYTGPLLGRVNELQTLTPSVPVVNVTWSGLSTTTQNPVLDYVVAIAWNRTGIPGSVMPNVDLEVWDTSTPPQLIGRSAELAGSSERVVFHTSTSTVTIRLVGTALAGNTVGVQIAARQHPESHSNKHAVTGLVVEKIAQPTGCGPGPNPSQTVDRVIPVSYTDSYGSYPFANPVFPYFVPFSPRQHHFIFGGDTLGQGGFTANALYLRTWRPSYAQTSISTVNLLGLAQTSNLANPADPVVAFSSVYPNGTIVAQSLNIALYPPNVPPSFGVIAQHWNIWPIRIPFSTPFTFQPSTTDPNLAIWWDVSMPSHLYVDGIDDNTTTNCFWRPAGQGQPLWPGRAPVFGFSLVGGQMLPDLDVFGEPILNEWLWFRASGFQMQNQPSPSFLMLLLGLSNPGIVLSPSCFVLHSGTPYLSTVPLTWPSTNGVGDYAWKVPYDPALLVRDVWAQTLELDSSTGVVTQASPGLHLRIGGNY